MARVYDDETAFQPPQKSKKDQNNIFFRSICIKRVFGSQQ